MYHHLRGTLEELSPTRAVLEVGGVGYELRIPLSTYEQLKGMTDVVLLTHYHVREDDVRLFGFVTSAERELFRLVFSVGGVGPAIALAALSALSPREAGAAIAEGDAKTLQRIKGVGKKLAERLVLELRERVAAMLPLLGAAPVASGRRDGAPPAELPSGAHVEDSVKALVELGYDRKVAVERVGAVLRELEGGEAGPSPPIEDVVRRCLRMG